jgi:hypothetical protein
VKDTDDLLDKMHRMAELPRDERDGMGKAARAKMEQEFEKSLIVGKTLRAILD